MISCPSATTFASGSRFLRARAEHPGTAVGPTSATIVVPSLPTMVALVRDIITNEPKAIHRTALSLDAAGSGVAGVATLGACQKRACECEPAHTWFGECCGRVQAQS